MQIMRVYICNILFFQNMGITNLIVRRFDYFLYSSKTKYVLWHFATYNRIWQYIRANRSYSTKTCERVLSIRTYGAMIKIAMFIFYTEVKSMRASYKKLWKLLVDKDMSKSDLHKASGLSSSTMTKLRKGEDVSMEALRKICICLDCNIGDIVEFVDESK